jgi:hypothetical protein
MTTHPIIADLIALLNQICALKESGLNISHKESPQELGWAWFNENTNQRVGFIGLNKIKGLISTHKARPDPRIKYLIGFATGGHAIAARDAINKLEKIKAFW